MTLLPYQKSDYINRSGFYPGIFWVD